MLFVNKFKLYNMREIKVDPNWRFPKTRRTDFTKEEMVDIIDFYLQYKPMLEEYLNNEEDSFPFEPRDFTRLLYMYNIFDINYLDNIRRIKKKYGNKYIKELSKEKLDFLEIITMFSFIYRADHHSPGWYEDCMDDGTYYNLLCRLEEIKSELETNV